MNNDLNFNFQTPEENPEDNGLNGLNESNGLNGLNGSNGFESDPEDADNTDMDGIDAAEISPGETEDAAALGAEGESAAAETEPERERHRFVMPDRLSVTGILKAFRDYWNGFSNKIKIIIASSAGGLILLAVILTVALNQTPIVIAYSGLDDIEIGEITSILQTSGIYYEVDTMFKTISVKESDRSTVVGTLAMQGYPQSGRIVYEEETSGNILETSAEKTAREKRNLERKITAHLDSISGVNYSSVILTVPDNGSTVLRSERAPSRASVTLHLRPGAVFSPDAIRGIENMIQKSVDNLQPEDIIIIDGNGNQLNIDMEDSGENRFATVAEIKEDFELRKKREIYGDIMELLSPVFGEDGITIAVTVKSNFDDLITEAKNYFGANFNPDTEQQSGIPERSAIDYGLTTQDPDAHGYAPGDLNPDADGYYEFAGDISEGVYSEDYHRLDEFLVDYVFTQSQRMSPEITNIGISVWVNAPELDDELIDAFYHSMSVSTGINDIVMKNLSEDDEYEDYLRNYIAIIATRFTGLPDVLPAPRPGEVMRMFQMLMILGASVIVIIILVICIIAAMSRKSREREIFEQNEAAVLAAGGADAAGILDPGVASLGLAAGKRAAGISAADDEDDMDTIEAKEKTLRRQIKLFAEHNPEIAAQLVRTLIKGDEMPGG
ncbi:MAG: hypothetical protein FWH10_05230 [Oscillospiraceae bacterium]|nr:hypothetical protein [Oscillospiraceae bacterium]